MDKGFYKTTQTSWKVVWGLGLRGLGLVKKDDKCSLSFESKQWMP